MQFKKQLLPYLVQALDPKLLERGNEAALKKRIEELVEQAGKMGMGTREVGDLIAKMVS